MKKYLLSNDKGKIEHALTPACVAIDMEFNKIVLI